MRTLTRLLVCFAVVLTIAAPPALAAPARPDEAFTVSNYVVNVQVSEDEVYTVDESIAVHFTEPRHGIFRDIPTGDGTTVGNVTVDGCLFTMGVSGGNFEIRMGDPNTMVEGDQTYNLHYTLTPAGRDDIIRFYIIGTGWNTAIDKVSFSVTLPKPFDASRLGFNLGLPGNLDNDNPADLQFSAQGNTVSGSVLRALKPHEYLLMRLELPQGYFAAANAQPDPDVPVKEPLPVEPDVGVPDDGGTNMMQPALGSFALPGILVGLLVFLGFGAVVAAVVVIAVVSGRKTTGAGNPADPAMQGMMLNETMLEQQRLQQMNMQHFQQTDFTPPPPPPDPPSSGGGSSGGGGSW